MSNKKLAQPLQVRFDSLVTIDVVSILKDYIEGRSDVKYSQLLNLKNDPHVNDAFLLLILQQVNNAISLLVPKVEQFVYALLNISWTSRPPAVLDEYLSFVQTLVSAHTYYCKPVVKMLVSNLTLNPDTELATRHAHDLLRRILELIPLSQRIVLDSLNDCFPYIGSGCTEQVNYVRNLLMFAEYHVTARSYILNIITGRMIKLDSRVPIEDLLKSFGLTINLDNSVNNQAVQTLDEMMKVMFELCNAKCRSDWDVHRSFYYDMYAAFESLILPAVGIHHVHYLMFYICSTKPILYETYIERLWTMFQNPSSPLNIRKSSADYLASFLGKAAFVPMKVVNFCLERVCKWIHAYLDRQVKGEGIAVFKIRAHAAFYAACHIPFYVVAARHHDYLGNKKLLTELQALDLTRIVSSSLNPLRYCHATTVRRIVSSSLNPLRYCHATTVRQFAESASHLQVVFCHTIMIRNQRVCLPEATTDTFVMETEYPFEKYLLPMSMNFVSSLVIDKPIGRDDSLYDSDQVMEELLSESPRVGGFMHHFLG
uniref:RNA polymerase I-specific transcription initiation factor RRN3 n=1 Tax=Daphnia magna TaxID=35525 RepID=A0A0N8E1Q1_9CRUS